MNRLLGAGVLALLVTFPALSWAQLGEAGTPLVPVPVERWGDGDLVPGPILVDSTWVSGEPFDNPFPVQVDVAGDYLFMATGQGFKTFEISDPSAPSDLGYVDASSMKASGLYWGHSDKNQMLSFISAPPDNPNLLAAGVRANGTIIFDTSKKFGGDYHYQDAGSSGHVVSAVHAATIAGIDYLFASSQHGVVLYNMTSASQLSRCVENTLVASGVCPGVYLGILPRQGGAFVSGTADFVAVRSGSTRVEIYRLTEPTEFPTSTARLDEQLPATGAGVALWEFDYDKDGTSELYLAALTRLFANDKIQSYLSIYDVSCVYTSSNCALGDPQVRYDVTDGLRKVAMTTIVTASVDDGVPYLAVGSENWGSPLNASDSCVEQREYLLDMSRYDPTAPPTLKTLDLTPTSAAGGYWAWYDATCRGVTNGEFDPDPPGFNSVVPMTGVVSKGYYYRAGFGICDSHQILASGAGGSGTGGAGGSDNNGGTGGADNAGGIGGSANAAGTGGGGAADGGVNPGGSPVSADPSRSDEGACSCRAAGGAPGGGRLAWLWPVLAALMLSARRGRDALRLA